MQQTAKLTVFTDGGARGNPGPGASGVVIMDDSGRVLESFGQYLGVVTNNQAEWTAVKLALEAVAKYQPQAIDFLMDSELVCRQLNGQYRVKNPELQLLYAAVRRLSVDYSVSWRHIYRARNKLADAEVNKAIDAVLAGGGAPK